MTQFATVIVPPVYQANVTGITRIEISARKIKAWGFQQDEAPLFSLSRKATHGDVLAMSFLDLAALIRQHGERRA